MASGLAVVGARSGGTIDLVQPNVTGRIFEPGIASDLRAQLRYLLAYPDRQRAMGHAGRAAAERRSWSSVIDELLGYYQHVISRSTRQARV